MSRIGWTGSTDDVQCLGTRSSKGLTRTNRCCRHDLHCTTPIDRCYPEIHAKQNIASLESYQLSLWLQWCLHLSSLSLCASKWLRMTYTLRSRQANFYTEEMTRNVSKSTTVDLRHSRTRAKKTRTNASGRWRRRTQLCHRHSYAEDEQACNCPLQI